MIASEFGALRDKWRHIGTRASAWAERDERVLALFLAGSFGRGEGDELSDLDLLVVTRRGFRDKLWGECRTLAAELGRPLGVFAERAGAHARATAFYEGPLKVDLWYHDGEVEPLGELAAGYEVLVDKAGREALLRARLRVARHEARLMAPDEWSELDARAWHLVWCLAASLERGRTWSVYVMIAEFAETVLLRAYDTLAEHPWQGAAAAHARLPARTAAELEAALPKGLERDELGRALDALIALYRSARDRLRRQAGVRLDDALMEEVRGLVAQRAPGRARRSA